MKEKISTDMLVFEETFTDGDKESVMVELWQWLLQVLND